MWPFGKKAGSGGAGGRPAFDGDIASFAYAGAPPENLSELSDLEQLFWSKNGPMVHKWHHYFEIYDRYFSRFRGSGVRMLEIGVSKGGSLDLWRQYLGPDAVIYGIDIDPDCARYDGISGQVRIGSQADPDFLASVVDEMGGVDLILDDGSHDSRHIRASLTALFPRLSENGVYMIEDLHAAYWPSYSGGYGSSIGFMADVKQIIDDMHHWYHDQGQRHVATRDHVAGLHIHDSIVVIEKRRVTRPTHSQQGETRAGTDGLTEATE